ncbi:MAG: GlsB/YeaQ/YmgE family stress response membrane protein [Betaproteobacteria bacterium]|nr:MAG: GlsB/YeaQ/YmgE family stress response membrane protein [Betaproteobacteria bacterium]
MGIIWTIVLGFVIGVMAKLLHPGKDNMGFLMTIGLGITGAFVAGIVGEALGWYKAGEGAGFSASVIAAIVILFIYSKIKGNRPPQSGSRSNE